MQNVNQYNRDHLKKKTGVILYKDSMYEIVSEYVHTQTEELSLTDFCTIYKWSRIWSNILKN